MADPGLLADAVERLRVLHEAWAAELVRDLTARPAVARELHRRQVHGEARRLYAEFRAAGLSTRAAADATRRRLLALGFTHDVPCEQTIRQHLGTGSAPARCTHTAGASSIGPTPKFKEDTACPFPAVSSS